MFHLVCSGDDYGDDGKEAKGFFEGLFPQLLIYLYACTLCMRSVRELSFLVLVEQSAGSTGDVLKSDSTVCWYTEAG